MLSYIYGLFDPISSELRYIGKTINPARRLANHLGPKMIARGKSSLYEWLRDITAQGLKPSMKILVTCKRRNENKFEKKLITYYRNRGVALLNERCGGDGWQLTVKRRWSEKCYNGSMARMRKVTIRDSKSQEEITFISTKDAASYLKVSTTTINGYLKKKPGMRLCRGYYVRYAEEPFKLPTNRLIRHSIKRINLDTGEEKFYKRSKDVELDGYDRNAVLKVCKGYQNRKTHFGYGWEFCKYDE